MSESDKHATTTDSPSYRAGATIEQYMAVARTDSRTVEPITAGTADDFAGIAKTSAEAGEEVGVKDSNQGPVQASDDATIEVPAHLVPSDTAGQLRDLNTGGASGETIADSLGAAVKDEDDDGLVLMSLNRR